MKTFKQFIEEAYSSIEIYEASGTYSAQSSSFNSSSSGTPLDLARQKLQDALHRQRRIRRIRSSASTTGGTRFSPQTKANVNLANLQDLKNRWNSSPKPTIAPTTAATTRTAGAGGLAAVAAPVAVGLAAAAAQGEIAQRQQVAGTRRATGALPGEIKGLNPELIRKDHQRKVISDTGGAGGKVTTNTNYTAKLGKVEGKLIRGESGQRMFKAGPDELGKAKPTPFSILNPHTWTKPEVGKRYQSKLGGVKGTVTYDANGNRSFQALMPPKK
jgi:hypothetical protein